MNIVAGSASAPTSSTRSLPEVAHSWTTNVVSKTLIVASAEQAIVNPLVVA
jgi:hypothetical protein